MQETAQRDGRRRNNRNRNRNNRNRRPEGSFDRVDRRSNTPAPSGFSKFLSFISFGLIGGSKKKPRPSGSSQRPVTNVTYSNGSSGSKPWSEHSENREPRPPREPRPAQAPREVTSERLHVGNLSFDTSESDLFELFNGVGSVRNAEIVVNKHNQRSKGFGFITMSSLDEAKRAVAELHNKEFMGRTLTVGGAKPPREQRDEPTISEAA
jgi:RNA recognition motif-containing protein